MTADRSEELIRAMLLRRAMAPPPWLADDTMRTIRTAPQRRAGRSGGLGLIPWIGVIAATGVLAIFVVAVTLGTRLLGGERQPGPDPSAVAGVLVPTPQPSAAASPTAVGSVDPPDATPADEPVADPPAPVLESDSLAVVTADGDRLRVRTKPGLGAGSKRLDPLLEAGTRMLVVDGPVEVDGYQWYEILVDPRDEDLFGWVAAGKDGNAWIAPAAPDCAADTWPLAVPDIELLACFGDRPLTIQAQVSEGLGPLSEGADAAELACPDRVDRGGCDVTQGWLRFPGYQFATLGNVDRANAWVAIPPGSPAQDLVMRDGDAVILSGQWDAPEARDCRVVDSQTGADVVSRDEAISRCRVVFVVRSIERER